MGTNQEGSKMSFSMFLLSIKILQLINQYFEAQNEISGPSNLFTFLPACHTFVLCPVYTPPRLEMSPAGLLSPASQAATTVHGGCTRSVLNKGKEIAFVKSVKVLILDSCKHHGNIIFNFLQSF